MAMEFWLRDSWTGQSVTASVRVEYLNPATLTEQHMQMLRSGRQWQPESASVSQVVRHQGNQINLQPSDQLQRISITSSDYHPLQTWIEPHQNVQLNAVWLQPLVKPKACAAGTLCGYVVSAMDYTAVTEATVMLEDQAVLSDEQGFFSMRLSDDDVSDLTIEAIGYKIQLRRFMPDDRGVHMIIELSPGAGVEHEDLMNPLLHMQNGQIDLEWQWAKLQQQPTLSSQEVRERPGGAVYIQPPLSIRVGFDNNGGYCCGNGCATSQVFGLEYYVQRGLDNEWISSWQSDSLKAGTVPFRSYGAWHVLNSPYSGYDICAGPCCQAFESTGYNSVIDAAAATHGLMLELNGSLARSEYSAENNSWNDPNDGLNCSNNDLSCGDGFVGSPATGWSCLYDGSEGRGCFGHGRGMSQWGTQYRAISGDNWADIVDHYYNALGNPSGTRSQYASTPIRLDSIQSDLTQVLPGQTLELQFAVFNGSDISGSFGPVMLGASLLNTTESYSDPVNDSVHVVDLAGLQSLNRDFVVPAEITPGVYDLAVALWLDVNSDSVISSQDWVLAFTRENGLIEVLADTDLIFANSFENNSF